jgi:uncharacterized protein YfaS (alpha-2-macroglobulin family)
VQYEVFRAEDWQAEYSDEDEYSDLDEDGGSENTGDSEGYDGGYGETVTQGNAILDENGKAVIHFTAKAPDNEDAMQAQVFTANVTVTDASGREVEGDGRARVTTGDFHISVEPKGYVGAPGKATQVTLTAKDYEGKPRANVPIRLESGYWQWQKTKSDGDAEKEEGEKDDAEKDGVEKDDDYQFQLMSVRNAVTDKYGKATVSIMPMKTGELRLNASAQDGEGHNIRARAELWAANDEGGDFETEYPDLALLTDKKRYNPGETARVLINADRIGQTALLTIEGEKIYRAISVPIKRHSTVVQVPILTTYGPNVFLAACYVNDKRFASSEIPLRVALPQQQVAIEVRPDRTKYQPGDKITYQVQTTDKQHRPVPCEFSFGVVDESIYALQEDDPNI